MAAAMLASVAFGQIQYRDEERNDCIHFVNGAGHYADHCYISGLKNMAPGTCYKVRNSRIADGSIPTVGHMNDDAANTWFWKPTECTKHTVKVPIEGTYTLEPKCVEFHNGSGNYAANCYSSGLYDMQPGKCYTVNPDRKPAPEGDGTLPQNDYMNNSAIDGWWWVETECYNLLPIENPQTSECDDPNSQACLTACLADPSIDQACEAVICGDDPTNQYCRNQCSVNLNSIGCQAYCNGNTSDPICPQPGSGTNPPSTTRPDECVTDPNGSVCQDFCFQNPTDGACDKNFCANNPDDPNCFDKCINFVNGSGNYAANCYKSGLHHMQAGKCYAVNPARVADGSAPQTGHMNDYADNAWWWVETTCEKEFITPRNPGSWTLGPEKCVAFVNGNGHYTDNCYNSGLHHMEANKCYAVNPDRGPRPNGDGSAPVYGHMNDYADDAWWWVETLCQDTIPARAARPGSLARAFEPKASPKAATTLGETKISFENATLSVTTTVADAKMIRVFDMNGKLLHSVSFNGMAKDVDFAKFAGKGILLVRITSGDKLVAMKQVSIR